MNNLNDFKKEYDNTFIPEELGNMINNIITDDIKISTRRKYFKTLISSAAAITILAIPLNISPAFAQTISDVPFIGAIAKVLTIKNYTKQSENIKIEVNMPAVSELSDWDYQNKINSTIDKRVQLAIKEATIRVDEYKEAYIETGGTQEEFKEKNMKVEVDYKVYSTNNNILSFLVVSYDSVAAAYAEYSYYNIDLINNSELKLKTLLGENFQTVITNSVKNDIAIQKNNSEIAFLEDIQLESFVVRDDIDFYINENSDIVIVFEKYEIASGADGRLEYVIKK